MIDPQEAIDFRIQINSGTDVVILECLESIMREHNIFSRSYDMMEQEISHPRDISKNAAKPEMQLLFTLKSGYDKNSYNFQRSNKVAAVFVTTSDGDILK